MEFMKKTTTTLILTALVIFGTGTAQATKTISRNLDQQIHDAEYVVRVHVDTIETSRDSRTGFNYNFYHFSPLEVLKGWPAKKTIVIRLINTNVSGHYKLSIPELPEFKVGEELILFLGKLNNEGRPALLGFSHGVYRIYQTNTAQKAIAGDVQLPAVLLDKSRKLVIKNARGQQVLGRKAATLEDFTSYIKDKVSHTPGL